jgi:hypothetical protein
MVGCLESEWRHLPEILSHDFLQKVRGFVDRFTWLRGVTTILKYSYGNQESRQKFKAI